MANLKKKLGSNWNTKMIECYQTLFTLNICIIGKKYVKIYRLMIY